MAFLLGSFTENLRLCIVVFGHLDDQFPEFKDMHCPFTSLVVTFRVRPFSSIDRI